MFLIINSPISTPISSESAPTVMDGTRGLVAKEDGWYDVKSDGSTERIVTDTELSDKVDKVSGKGLVSTADICTAVQNNDLAFADGKKITLKATDGGDTGTNKLEASNVTLEFNNMRTSVWPASVHVEYPLESKSVDISPTNVEIRGGTGVVHSLSEKANTTDVFLKSDDVVLAKDKIIKVIKDGESTVYDGSTENIQIRGDGMSIRANDVEPYGLMLSKNGITLETDNNENVNIKSGEITVYKKDSNGNSVAHKLTEKMSVSELESYLSNGGQKLIFGGLHVNGGTTGDISLWRVENDEPVTHKLSEKANAADIGKLSDLETTDKSSIVAAINEVNDKSVETTYTKTTTETIAITEEDYNGSTFDITYTVYINEEDELYIYGSGSIDILDEAYTGSDRITLKESRDEAIALKAYIKKHMELELDGVAFNKFYLNPYTTGTWHIERRGQEYTLTEAFDELMSHVDVLDNLTYDSTNDIINSDANLLLTDTSSVAAYNGTFRGEIKVGQLGENKWAYSISPTTGFSTSVDVTCTSGNKVHSLANKADSSDVLAKTNTAKFTPTGDYQPATKKYVDDAIAALKSELGLE